MASVDGKSGLKLKDFIAMWESDGTKLIEQTRRSVNGHLWLLYAVYFPESTYVHGRHMAMLLKVDMESTVILLHDLTNITGEISSNYRDGIDAWFERHLKEFG